jgi:hypothetical protein
MILHRGDLGESEDCVALSGEHSLEAVWDRSKSRHSDRNGTCTYA